MPNYTTPGVYVEEISTLPASIAQVETAIPAFVGYTASGDLNTVVKIRSLLDFEEKFGSLPSNESIEIQLNSSNVPTGVSVTPVWYLYRSIRLFYANGGGDCYVVSVGNYNDPMTTAVNDINGGFDLIRKVDEPTLLLAPDAVKLTATQLADVQKHMLKQCGELQDRFAILDVKQTASGLDTDMTNFRSNIGTKDLKYGAAYYPYIHASGSLSLNFGNVALKKGGATIPLDNVSVDTAPITNYNNLNDDIAVIKVETDKTWEATFNTLPTTPSVVNPDTKDEVSHYLLTIKALAKAMLSFATTTPVLANSDVLALVTDVVKVNGPVNTIIKTVYAYQNGFNAKSTTDIGAGEGIADADFDGSAPATGLDYALGSLSPSNTDTTIFPTTGTDAEFAAAARPYLKIEFYKLLDLLNGLMADAQSLTSSQENLLKSTNTVYGSATRAASSAFVTVPPSGAIAGLYAYVDRTRGVWKAPANVSLNGVVGVDVGIDDGQQGGMNVDPSAGKSVNAIRVFKDKGVIVWGGRTLAGNDNEWRYINVRRLFIMIEESTSKAMDAVVFEGNNAETWQKVKGSITNFLTGLWRDGALAGAKPEHAFFVNIGLGKTMTPQDILEGRLIVEIGIAAVRPAEFIILKFMHKLQES